MEHRNEQIIVKQTLILKLNATGDVVRTSSLLRVLPGEVTWITAEKNRVMVESVQGNVRCLTWETRERAQDRSYDLVINLEDEVETAQFATALRSDRMFGAYLDRENEVRYTADSSHWFDLSLISSYGRAAADRLKLQNRRSYQELIFEGLGLSFRGERYVMPEPMRTGLHGDVAIAPAAGPVWPMKNWAHYGVLQQELERHGLSVNVLPKRDSLLEHLGDVGNHRLLIGGDSLPMHLALGLGVPCVTLFTCTSPWEIYDYGILTKVVSPLLPEFFYQRGFDERAVTAIGVKEVLDRALAAVEKELLVG